MNIRALLPAAVRPSAERRAFDPFGVRAALAKGFAEARRATVRKGDDFGAALDEGAASQAEFRASGLAEDLNNPEAGLPPGAIARFLVARRLAERQRPPRWSLMSRGELERDL